MRGKSSQFEGEIQLAPLSSRDSSVVLSIFENGKEHKTNVSCRRECRQLQSKIETLCCWKHARAKLSSTLCLPEIGTYKDKKQFLELLEQNCRAKFEKPCCRTHVRARLSSTLRLHEIGTFKGKKQFPELLEGIKGNHARCFSSTFSSCASWAGAWCLSPAALGSFKTSKWGNPSSSTRISTSRWWMSRWWNFDDIV